VSILAHKVELQGKAKLKREAPKPPQRSYQFNEGGQPAPSKPLTPPMSTSNPKPPISKPPLNPHKKRRCYKCQVLGHIALDCPNRNVITLAECQALEEVEWEQGGDDKEVHLIEVEEECVVEVDKGELLVLRRALSGFCNLRLRPESCIFI